MIEERTYPRVWWRVNTIGDVYSKEFDRETTAMLFCKGIRQRKSDCWGTWYPTEDEALTVSASLKARYDERQAITQKRVAAPELYDALEALTDIVADQLGGDFPEPLAAARAALAKARGDA